MRVAAVQMQPTFGQIAENLARAERLIRSREADLYVLPELFSTGYLFKDRAEVATLAEPYPNGATCAALIKLSADANATVVGGFAERAPQGGLYNSAIVCSRGQAIACYRKIQLFDRELEWFDPGDRPPRVYALEYARIGPLICFDWIYPELTRALAIGGMQILTHCANLVLPYCQDATVTRCLENRVFSVLANRIGGDVRHGIEITFTGRSQITSPSGERVACGTCDREEVLVAEIDPAEADNKQLTPHNDLLRDRRPEMYRALCD